MKEGRFKLGIDVGGTFTDFFVAEGDRAPVVHKVLSTPADPSLAVLQGIRELAQELPRTTTYHQIAGGGGGFGDPRERDRAKLVEEVRNGVISARAARDIYGLQIEESAATRDVGTGS